MSVAHTISNDELVALFTGVEHEDGGWETTPYPDVQLALEIALRVEPASEVSLRKAMFGERSCDLIDVKALYVIGLAYARYRVHRDLQRRNRGL